VRALDVEDLTVRFEGPDRPAVEDVSFGLEEGQIAILIGPNGWARSPGDSSSGR
jgi:ABC-type Mn2+/Zn2+ transport system ATPase subunit